MHVPWGSRLETGLQDGFVADITADQFDDVPQLWWPADARRYSFDVKAADDAHKLRREKVGIERWQELMEKDTTVVAKTRLKWMELERQRADEDTIEMARSHWRGLIKKDLAGKPPPPRPQVDIREPLLLVGTCNDWNLELAQNQHRFEPIGGGNSRWQESHLYIRVPDKPPNDYLAFQVISARALWDWRLYPDSENNEPKRLLCDMRAHVPVALLEGTDHSSVKGRDFHIKRPCPACVDVRVALSSKGLFHVWFTEHPP